MGQAGSSTPTTATCAAATAPPASRSTRSGRPTGELSLREPDAGQEPQAVDRPRPAERGRSRRSPACGNGRGAFVAMDPRNGEVLALGSTPSFDPNVFAKPLTERALQGAARRRTTARRCSTARSSGVYPTGSTFKPITAIGRRSRAGAFTPGHGHRRPRLGADRQHRLPELGRHAATARSRCAQALQVSSDVFFYTLGARLNSNGGDQALQTWAPPPRHRPPHRHRPARRVRRACCRRRAWRDQPVPARTLHRPPVVGRRQRQPRRRPGRPAGHAAADGRRLLDVANGGRRARRTSACEVEDAAGRVLQIDPARRGRKIAHRPG